MNKGFSRAGRRFTPPGCYGKIAQPLTQLTKKAEPDRVLWMPESEQAFHSLHKLLECMLTIPLASDC